MQAISNLSFLQILWSGTWSVGVTNASQLWELGAAAAAAGIVSLHQTNQPAQMQLPQIEISQRLKSKYYSSAVWTQAMIPAQEYSGKSVVPNQTGLFKCWSIFSCWFCRFNWESILWYHTREWNWRWQIEIARYWRTNHPAWIWSYAMGWKWWMGVGDEDVKCWSLPPFCLFARRLPSADSVPPA